MTMVRGVTEIDRLIEQGLTLYGEGDLDGALLLWERVLVIDPENPQANSYVEYVRMNYELLTTDGNIQESGPYGIGNDEPEYQIEILPGDTVAPAVPAPLYMDARDEGWVIGDEGKAGRRSGLLLELDADEPPAGEPSFETAKTGENVSFDDATREYPGGAGRPATALLSEGRATEPGDFSAEITPGFGSAEDLATPQGFGAQTTDIRRRDLGFVQPTEERRIAPGPPELKMTLRTPSQAIPLPVEQPDVHRAPTADGDEPDPEDERGERGGSDDRLTLDDNLTLDLNLPPGPGLASAYESLDLDLPSTSDAQADLAGRADTRSALADAAGEAVDLIATLPTPRPPTSPTRPLPGQTRLPAADTHEQPSRERPDSSPPPATAGTAQTQELPLATQLDPGLAGQPEPAQPVALTRDFSEKPTNQITGRKPPARPDDLITAPTRELGLRELAPTPRDRRASTEDETTGQVDIHKLRSARGTGRSEPAPNIDPIDARSAEILEDIDRNAPAGETREERTRRRITALLERATDWGRGSDLERAVTAVDLALSEDPNSALAQKLIHRNRDTIMNAFQGFLGDLQRAPQLARPLHELGSAPISPRAAFLLSRVDGTLSLDEILDVSGMPRLEAYRYLCQLFLRGILR